MAKYTTRRKVCGHLNITTMCHCGPSHSKLDFILLLPQPPVWLTVSVPVRHKGVGWV